MLDHSLNLLSADLYIASPAKGVVRYIFFQVFVLTILKQPYHIGHFYKVDLDLGFPDIILLVRFIAKSFFFL